MSFGAQKKSAKEEAYFLLILTPTTKEMADFAQKNDLEDKIFQIRRGSQRKTKFCMVNKGTLSSKIVQNSDLP